MIVLLNSMNYHGLLMNDLRSIWFESDQLHFIDQTQIPFNTKIISTGSYERIAQAIESLEIRGAPLIGVAAAYAIFLGLRQTQADENQSFEYIYNRLLRTRPTAVNLLHALELMKKVYEKVADPALLLQELKAAAEKFHLDDINSCDNIAQNGLQIFNGRSNVLTHCNTGSFAASGGGTALNVIKNAFRNDLVGDVYVDETRPLLQGARLNAFELDNAGIPFKIITDSMAATVLSRGNVDFVITGADRIARNGDTANKIGTLGLAVLCKYYNIPFYIAAPETTIDRAISTGEDIIIEERSPKEMFNINDIKITLPNYKFFNPSFDISPGNLIKAIITDKKVYYSPYSF